VIERELALQIARPAATHESLPDGFKDKLVILPFENRSHYAGQWNIGPALARQLTDQLKQADRNIVVENGTPAPSTP